MKTLILSLVAVALSMGQIHAQTLNDDHTFGEVVSKSIRYPELAHQQQKVSEAYVNFKVDAQGKITNMVILNASHVDKSFQQEINRVWQQLPPQSQKYQGDYVLPLSFVLDAKDKIKRAESDASILRQKSGQYTLLKEMVITGYL
ncbi:TonB family protein [Spirosoma flavum]|uniref:TonB family protein n=1 Tax=Spirosoma flavum TaxID=2048557 RepID=A0ABW6AMS6_9BACT